MLSQQAKALVNERKVPAPIFKELWSRGKGPTSFSANLKNVVKRSEDKQNPFPDFSVKSFRRNMAVILNARGIHPTLIAEMMDHSVRTQKAFYLDGTKSKSEVMKELGIDPSSQEFIANYMGIAEDAETLSETSGTDEEDAEADASEEEEYEEAEEEDDKPGVGSKRKSAQKSKKEKAGRKPTPKKTVAPKKTAKK